MVCHLTLLIVRSKRFQGWKGNVKALRLVLAMHDHFADERQRAAAAKDAAGDSMHNTPSSSFGTSNQTDQAPALTAEESVSSQVREDAWALPFIKLDRVQVYHLLWQCISSIRSQISSQYLAEALDPDLSTFVTISEVNSFTAQKPPPWRYDNVQMLQQALLIARKAFRTGLRTGQSVSHQFGPKIVLIDRRCRNGRQSLLSSSHRRFCSLE
jgi:hypothetical protein